MSAGIGTVAFFDALADEMNAHPERYAPLGEAEMVVEVVMSAPTGDFRARLAFEGLGCSGVTAVDGAPDADFRLTGPLEAWQAMFDDIVAHGRATGKHTINSLALMGDEIVCLGDDPMGLDKFSRFNQTLQEFLDGARHVAAGAR
ncbi:MAG TPA: hypothetical protein VEI83_10160 [Acidimicrobiales bacterium]|nr:hypothetical protein [Acidimicrobiales bacterium]